MFICFIFKFEEVTMTHPKPEPTVPVLPLEPVTEPQHRPAGPAPEDPPMVPRSRPALKPRSQKDSGSPLKS